MSWTNQTFKQLAERAAWRAHLKPKKKKKKKKATSNKLQASSPRRATIALELKIMSNNWTKFGPRIFINSKKLQAPSLTEPRHKRQASSSKHHSMTRFI